MHAATAPRTHRSRPTFVLLLLIAALAAIGVAPAARATDPSPGASVPSSPDPAAAMCESVGDLRLYVGFVRSQSLGEDGLLPVLVGVVASLAEARTLAGLMGETYRPLVDAFVVSLQDLEASVRGFRDQGTVGSGLVGLGGAISAVGVAMDALAAALQEPCPTPDPAASIAPGASASPAG